MYEKGLEHLVDVGAPSFAVGVGFGSVDAVREFHSADSRERDIDFAVRGSCLAQNIFDGAAASFACDEKAGIED